MADTPRDTHSSEASDPLESLVAEILDLPEDDQPRAFAELRSRFPEHEELLVRWEGAAQAIAPGPTVADAESGARDTTVDALRDGIAGYQILEVLGEGGMGTVYLAEQSEPVQRRVALKVIKLGMDGGRVLARFELERRALARMTHDCIARVFDAGTTTSGQPFFVMEYVAGVPLVEHCDTRSLPLEDRVELFRRVCAGVQHAHNKGVIHRDLKPANILVVSDGGQATPKIIDFGLARATDRALVQRASSTLMGCVLGTPEYMSPEQATAETDVDTRTDVYSLGVILYELLTGELPLLDLRRAGWREIQRVLRDVEPPRPSTRVSTASKRGTEIAQRRGTRADSLARRLRGDLDWIVVKALSKDPNRRYESAAELSMDLQRYLAGQPVHAVPPTVRYHATKFVQRHRVQVAAALVLLIVLLSAGIASTAFYLQATKDSREKQRQSRVARDEATETRRQQDIAQQHLDRFQRLATAVRLAEARRDVSSLQPAWPESVSALQSWLDDSGDPLVAQLPVIEATLRDLEADAVPVSATQRQAERESDPRYGSYTEWTGRLRSMERANEVRRGARQVERVAVPGDAPEDAAALLRLACSKYGYVCVEFGEEALGLALARRALERAEPIMRFEYYDGLAWALFHNGLDQEALEVSAKGVAAAPAFLKQHWATRDARLQKAVADPEAHLDRCRNMVTQLDRAIERARALYFANPADAFLDQTMRELRAELVRFASPDGTLAEVRRRLRWAKTIDTLTTEHPRAKVTWDQARQAIERADGVVASTRYARHPVALRPQTGLVPIGMNPITKLWEFYHLRSAWDPAADTDPASLRIPVHREDGTVDADAGVVFVLIPGGSFMMGAQRSDRGGPNYFRHADPHEFPVHDVELAPFFLARHEVTQGQWIRLSGAGNPSALQPDAMLTTGERITTSHPVENVSWDMCRTLLETHGLDLPTEAQWEYAARAGTTTLWFTGDDPSQLAGFANVFDQTGQRLIPSSTIRPAAFDDGYAGSSPVGTHRANAFGMHDMHGNKWEWCRELRATYFQPVAPGDGERSFGVGGDRVCRGGSCRTMIQSTRASIRNAESPTHRNSDIGVRAARRIRD